MTDNDSFLYALRQTPRPAFARDLKTRLDAQPVPARRRQLTAAVRLLAVACLAAVILLMASPQARAQVTEFITDIIVMNFGAVQIRATDHLIASNGSTESVPVERMSIEAAQSILPFRLPTWAPDGYTRQDSVTVIRYSANELGIGQVWTRAGSPNIGLSIMNNDHPQLVTGSDPQAREVQLVRTKGVIYEGSWDSASGRYGGTTLNLVWTENALSYMLNGQGISETDLIRMANSLP